MISASTIAVPANRESQVLIAETQWHVKVSALFRLWLLMAQMRRPEEGSDMVWHTSVTSWSSRIKLSYICLCPKNWISASAIMSSHFWKGTMSTHDHVSLLVCILKKKRQRQTPIARLCWLQMLTYADFKFHRSINGIDHGRTEEGCMYSVLPSSHEFLHNHQSESATEI